MLLGRADERREIEQALARARSGASAVLALAGEPGIGKTALLSYAADRRAGMRLLRARGIESEAQVPFGSLLKLIRPALVLLDKIPAPQAAALEAALACDTATMRNWWALVSDTSKPHSRLSVSTPADSWRWLPQKPCLQSGNSVARIHWFLGAVPLGHRGSSPPIGH